MQNELTIVWSKFTEYFDLKESKIKIYLECFQDENELYLKIALNTLIQNWHDSTSYPLIAEINGVVSRVKSEHNDYLERLRKLYEHGNISELKSLIEKWKVFPVPKEVLELINDN